MATPKSGYRYPRSVIESVCDFILPKVDHIQRFLGGSYIRELPTCGDLDLAFLVYDISKFQSQLSLLPGKWKRRGISSSLDLTIPRSIILQNEITGTFLPPTIQCDFWVIDKPGNWGALCAFCAGDGKLNIAQRSAASKKGFTLGFSLKKEGCDIYLPTEYDLYEYLGWDWIPYKKRSLINK
jgi:DNA polymerase/3'-5' exonuclease PolX